jgi:hypothetical protein
MYTATSGWLMTNLDPDPLTVSLALLWQISTIDWRNWIPESDFQ